MLNYPGIEVRLNCEAASVLTIDPEAENKVLFEGQPFTGNVILPELWMSCLDAALADFRIVHCGLILSTMTRNFIRATV